MINRKYKFCESHFEGVNPLTPDIIGYFRNKDYIIEISCDNKYPNDRHNKLIKKITSKLNNNTDCYSKSILLPFAQAFTVLWTGIFDISDCVGITIYDRANKKINSKLSSLCYSKEDYLNKLKEFNLNTGLFITKYGYYNNDVFKRERY